MMEEHDIELMERFLVPRRELPDILDKHADGVVKRLRPELRNIEKELKRGNKRFKAHGRALRVIEIECASRKATCPGLHPKQKGGKRWGAKDITLKIGLPTLGGGGVLSLLGYGLYRLIDAGVIG